MSGCSGCNKIRKTVTNIKPKADEPLIVEKSADPKKKVSLEYCGGGLRLKSNSGCHSCYGKGKYSLVTTEKIQFPSDDAKNGMFSQECSVGHTYYVTDKQAERLLKMTFTTPAGQTAHKFKRVEE